MTMYMDVAPDVALDDELAGQSIHFSVERTDDGGYVIGMIHRMGPAQTGDEGDASAHPGHHEAPAAEEETPSHDTADPHAGHDMGADETVYGAGVVETVDIDERRILLNHEPIEALGWPAMTMYMDVAPDVALDDELAGQSIHFSVDFSVERTDDGGYVIGMIHRMGPAAAPEDPHAHHREESS
jgi:Cu/Ag efflux protein CusF